MFDHLQTSIKLPIVETTWMHAWLVFQTEKEVSLCSDATSLELP